MITDDERKRRDREREAAQRSTPEGHAKTNAAALKSKHRPAPGGGTRGAAAKREQRSTPEGRAKDNAAALKSKRQPAPGGGTTVGATVIYPGAKGLVDVHPPPAGHRRRR